MRTLLLILSLPALLAAQPDCSVAGTVVNSVTGEPVPRARVVIISGKGQPGASSDNSGRFSLANIACGDVTLTVSRTGYLRDNVTASTGSPLSLKIHPQSAIAGKIVDDSGDAVPYAAVTLFRSEVVQGRRTLRQMGNENTNDLGEYRLFDLAGGRYTVCARPIRQMPPDTTVLGDVCYPGPLEAGPSGGLDVAPGTEARIDLNLPRVSAVHVRGTLSGMPANVNLGVSLLRRAPPGAQGANFASPLTNGRFDIAGVTPGDYLLSTDYYEEGRRMAARLAVHVGSSDIDGLSAHLDPAFSVTGTVRFELEAGVDPPAANLTLRAAEPSVGGGGIRWDEKHRDFTFSELLPGSYRLEGFLGAPFYVRSAMLNGRDISREETPITQASGPIEVTISDQAGTAEGTLNDADGRPATGAVFLLREGFPAHIAVAASDGHFKLTGLPPGGYKAYAWDDKSLAEYADPEWVKRFSPVSAAVQSGQTTQLKLTLAKAGP